MRAERWFDAVSLCQAQGKAYVIATVLGSAGSTPREAGAKMVICDDDTFDTIGGGHLEHEVTRKGRELLLGAKQTQLLEHYPLSSKLGQCCGGAVNVLFEVIVQHTQTLALFGAGHVAHALVPILAQLPLQIHWVDNRPELFVQAPKASNIKPVLLEEPQDHVAQLKSGDWVLVMTHNHQLDYDIVKAALKRADLDYVGMIGSDTKARRFRTRLEHQGTPPPLIDALISPVGLLNIPGKRPIEVAISIAGQIVQQLNSKDAAHSRDEQKQAWKQSKELKAQL